MIRKVGIKEAEFYAFHGFYEEEQKVGGMYLVSIEVKFNANFTNDNLDNTLNYEVLHQILTEEMSIKSKLIEHIAERVVNKVVDKFKNVSVWIRIEKLNPPLNGKIKSTYTELTND